MGEKGFFEGNGADKKVLENEIRVNLVNYMDVYKRIEIHNNIKNLIIVTASKQELDKYDLKRGDVLITPSSETAEDIARVSTIDENLENTIYSYHLVRYRPFEKSFYTGFLNYLLETSDVRKQFILMAQGVQRFVIKNSDFQKTLIKTPSIDEQRNIYLLLNNIDSLITLHQRKQRKEKKGYENKKIILQILPRLNKNI
ncbi:restriction endonuclease subunit S [Mycoplasma struthionis]|uniref:Restriction endonuclease subunit S n=1 Tax=Mycoplasma struthionis TaxID=538220 RepID=A0A3G8LGX8_9MOLU|nr:restriction endonuclease subunit S [Mycoplasma struthionis]AZG68936.1 restriction endonuclease subunit S [Mycoplasma struthionis]